MKSNLNDLIKELKNEPEARSLTVMKYEEPEYSAVMGLSKLVDASMNDRI